MTDIVRTDTPRQSTSGVIAMAGLGLGMVLFAVLTILGVFYAWDDLWLSVWFAMIFVLLAVFLDVYRREFVPDELIHKKRRPKIVQKRDIR